MGQDNCKCITVNAEKQQNLNIQQKKFNLMTVSQTQISQVIKILAPNMPKNSQYYTLAVEVLNKPNQQFQDFQFLKLQQNQHTGYNSLNKLYNFTKRKIQYVYKVQQTNYNIFHQKQLQLCYLTSLFYLICKGTKLRQQIFVTKIVNKYKAYILRLYKNGKLCDIVVNDFVPTFKQNLKYLTMNNFDQIWPFILEKAWCKKIGGYDKAKGLSPQDCFQQITGAPAQSYILQQGSIQQYMGMIVSAIKQKFWPVLISKINDRNQQKLFQNRQVVYIQSYNQQSQTLLLRSAYLKPKQYQNQNKSLVELFIKQINQHFDFLTIGYYIQSYTTKLVQFTSKSQEQKIFQIVVSTRANINIRLIQFYSEYLKGKQKEHYRYSPVLLEIYDSNFGIVDKCEGRFENLFGIRSANASELVFANLEPGSYYLRVQVDWIFQDKINNACLVVYGQINQVSLKPYQNNTNVKDILQKLLIQTFSDPMSQVIDNNLQQLRIKHIQKSCKHLLLIQNTSKKLKKIKIDFKNSNNIRINHIELISTSLILQLSEQAVQILQILPLDPIEPYFLAPFDILQI